MVIKSPANAGWGGGKGIIAIYTSEPAVKHQRGRFHQVTDITGSVREVHVTSRAPCLGRPCTRDSETCHVTYTLLSRVLCELHIENIVDVKVRTAFVVEHKVFSCFSSYVRLRLPLRIPGGDFIPLLSPLCFHYYVLINLIVFSFKFKSKAFSKLPKKKRPSTKLNM